MGVHGKGVRHLDRAQEIEPDLADAHAGRTLFALYAQDYESTIEHARKALAENPNHSDVLAWLYNALIYLDRGDEAHGTHRDALARL